MTSLNFMNGISTESSDATLVTDRSPPSSPHLKDNFVKQVSPPSSPLAKQAFSSQISPTVSPTMSGRIFHPFIADVAQCYPGAPPVSIGSHLYKTAGGSSLEIPVASDTFDMLLNRPGAVWVNRLPFLYSLIPVRLFKGDFERKLGLVRRPSGFGQMLFDTTALFAFNHHCESVFRRFFGTSPPLDHHYMTLFIDMACVFTRPTESPTCAMKKYMSGVLKDFFAPTPRSSIYPSKKSTGVLPFPQLQFLGGLWSVESVYEAGYSLIVIIENFNIPLINSTPETISDIEFAIAYNLVNPIITGIDDQVITGGMILGKPESEEPSWVRDSAYSRSIFDQIARDISHEACVHGAFGYTWDQIRALADEVLSTPEERAECLEIIQSTCAKHQDPERKYVEYSVDDVLTRLRGQKGLPARHPSPEPFYYESDE
ncbi:hypothetical protein CPB85DRAFT_1568154 [Mucidula mucida]|nr:hypothetical protein CPB85DRAFT_1568154 [Mucidula mucida]